MNIAEVTIPTPEQQRIKAMQAQVKRAQEAVKAERASQKIAAWQKVMAILLYQLKYLEQTENWSQP
jgi:hypothetical protein